MTMILTIPEVSIVWKAITATGKNDMRGMPEAKLFPLAMQKDAASLAKEIKVKCFSEAEENGQFKFHEGEVELSLDEKKLLKTCLERDWYVTELENVLSVKEKIEKD